MPSRVAILNHRGGPQDGKPFLVNVDLVAYAVSDPPGVTLYFTGLPNADTKVNITQTLDQLANNNRLIPPG